MSAIKNLTFEHGATFSKPFTLYDANRTPVPLNSFINAFMEIRKKTPPFDLVFSLTNANGRIILTNSATGTIELKVDKADVTTIPIDAGPLEYDLFLVKADGYSMKLLRGDVLVERKVTQAV